MRPVSGAGVLWRGSGAQVRGVASTSFKRCSVAFGESGESSMDDWQSIRQTRPVRCWARALRRLQPQATQMRRQRREFLRMRRFCLGGAPQALLEGAPHGLVVGSCISPDFKWGNRAQSLMLGLRGGTRAAAGTLSKGGGSGRLQLQSGHKPRPRRPPSGSAGRGVDGLAGGEHQRPAAPPPCR